MSHYYTTTNGLTQFLHRPPANYEPLSTYMKPHVGAVPKRQKSGDEVLLLGSKRILVPQGGEWVRRPNGLTARLFVHCKTRRKDPFFIYPEHVQWDGSLIGLKPTVAAKERFTSLKDLCNWLNSLDWDELGCYNTGRYQFQQRSLANLLVQR